MANYFVRGNKLWINYTVDDKRYRKSTGLSDTKQNRKIVEQTIIPQLESKIATGEIYKKKPKTFCYYGNIFLKHKEKSLRAFTQRLPYFERVIEYFKNRNIDTITRLDIKEYLNNLNMKSRSKCIYKSCINEIFELAVDDGVISMNPSLNIKLPNDEKAPVQFFKKEEVEKLLSVATGIMKPYLLIAFNTGMRPEELLGLQFTDIKDNIINIVRVRTKGRVDYPKTKNSFRKVPIAQFIVNEIDKLKSNSLYLFGNFDDAGKLRKRWSRVLKDANVEHKKLSATRHTFATLMLKDNIVSINELSGLLGHSSPKVTLTHYASVIDIGSINLGKNFALFGHDLDTIENKSNYKSHC
ncbi:MAG: tyrosine-type recombinase/integrase [Arcobacter sp.]|uniref:tyrosine-type recombinase/integrase n=1 Tax=Arcobacter sp. TaxID=1872629 RepID=UPI003C75C41A